MDDNSDSNDEDEWYNKMEQASHLISDDDILKDLEYNENKLYSHQNVTEDEYFSHLAEYNSTNNNSIIMNEQHPIWNNILQNIATSTIITTTNTSNQSMILINNTDYSSLLLVKNWLFSFLPKSSKLYVQISNMLLDTTNELNQYLYIDDYLHISMIIVFKIKHEDNCIDICFFTPYSMSRNEDTIIIIDQTMNSFIANYLNYDIVLSTIQTNFFETNIINNRYLNWNISWIEYCDVYTLEDYHHNLPSITSITNTNHSNYNNRIIANLLPKNYIYCKLSETDAELINNTWKYKSIGSLTMIKAMIATYPCYGIRYEQHTCGIDSTSDSKFLIAKETIMSSELVSWCLTYEYGAIGMLYTVDTHRGKGLAKAIVKYLLHQTKLRQQSKHQYHPYQHDNNNIRSIHNSYSIDNTIHDTNHPIDTTDTTNSYLTYPPFAYIEQSNHTSKQLFTSLGKDY